MDEDSKSSLRITGLCGSLRHGSYTRMALGIALRGAAESGARTQLIDLADYDLMFMDGRESGFPAGVLRLREAVKAADGLILGTPEYHGNFSGVLKNALDLMGFDEMEGKMIGLVGVSGGGMGAFDAMNGLRDVGRALHAWVIPQQAAVPEAWKEFDEHGNLKNRPLEDRLLEVGREVAKFAYLHKCGRVGEFLKDWEKAPVNPGGNQ
jgi:NAD(P)H-dependent FMN reductase